MSWISAKGETGPACPPAPAATAMSPSAPFSIALCAKRSLMMSCSVIPPYPCTAALTSSRAPSDVMTIGAFHLTVSAMSSSSRAFDLWTIWLTANGAAGRSGCARSWALSASVISCSHSSSWEIGRALSAGKAPTMPALHWAITSAGWEMMNNGAPMTGSLSLSLRTLGSAIETPSPFPRGRRRHPAQSFTHKPKRPQRASRRALSLARSARRRDGAPGRRG